MLCKVVCQHGDVVFFECNCVPKDAKKVVVTNGFIVEKGEGVHTHVINDVKDMEVYEKDGLMYLVINEPVIIEHEEHGEKVLDRPLIKEIENEYDYETEEARKTMD